MLVIDMPPPWQNVLTTAKAAYARMHEIIITVVTQGTSPADRGIEDTYRNFSGEIHEDIEGASTVIAEARLDLRQGCSLTWRLMADINEGVFTCISQASVERTEEDVEIHPERYLRIQHWVQSAEADIAAAEQGNPYCLTIFPGFPAAVSPARLAAFLPEQVSEPGEPDLVAIAKDVLLAPRLEVDYRMPVALGELILMALTRGFMQPLGDVPATRVVVRRSAPKSRFN